MGCINLLELEFLSFGYMPRSRIARSYGNSTFNLLRILHAAFYYGCTNSHPHQPTVEGVSLSKHFFNLGKFRKFTPKILNLQMEDLIKWKFYFISFY